MTREIKFRYFWNGEMYDVHTIDFGLTRINGSMVNGILMQFTGLLDKNGKEIYEGDIYKWGNTPPEYKEIPRYPDRLFHLIGERVLLPEDIEIIGNIYENPELIK